MPSKSPTIGCTYAYANRGKTLHVKVLRYDPVSKRHVVTTDGRHEWQIDAKFLGSRVRPTRTKTDTRTVFLYMCNIGKDTYKVGATCTPERRCKQIRTYTPYAKMKSLVKVPTSKGSQWAKLESSVLRRFRTMRPATGGREVLRLTAEQATECAQYMRSVCAGA